MLRRKMHRRGVLFLVVLFLLTGCVPSPSQVEPTRISAISETVSLTVDGLARSFLLRVPSHAEGEVLPVVIGLHGAGDSPEQFERYSEFTDSIEADQFIAVYPSGQPLDDGRLVWNAGTCCGNLNAEPVDDVGFLSDVITELTDYDANPDRIYVVGYSNGGMMTYGVACELGDRIAGITVVSGALNVAECPSSEPMPVYVIHGTADVVLPFDGGVPSESLGAGLRPWTNTSVWSAAQFWIGRDGCTEESEVTQTGNVATTTYTNCDADSFLSVSVIDGGEHIWPNDPNNIDATEVVLDGFITGD